MTDQLSDLTYVCLFVITFSGLLYLATIRTFSAGIFNPLSVFAATKGDLLGIGSWRNALLFGVFLVVALPITILVSSWLSQSQMFGGIPGGNGDPYLISSGITTILCGFLFAQIVIPGRGLVKSLIHCALAGVVGMAWLVFPDSLLVHNLTFLVLCYTIIHSVGPMKMKFVVVALLGIVVVDIWGVWATGLIPALASSLLYAIPFTLLVPVSLSDLNSTPMALIGAGDIIVSGVFILTASYYKMGMNAFVGYVLALVLGLGASLVLGGVPATVFLAPFFLTFIIVFARSPMGRQIVW